MATEATLRRDVRQRTDTPILLLAKSGRSDQVTKVTGLVFGKRAGDMVRLIEGARRGKRSLREARETVFVVVGPDLGIEGVRRLMTLRSNTLGQPILGGSHKITRIRFRHVANSVKASTLTVSLEVTPSQEGAPPADADSRIAATRTIELAGSDPASLEIAYRYLVSTVLSEMVDGDHRTTYLERAARHLAELNNSSRT